MSNTNRIRAPGSDADLDPMYATLKRTIRFVWEHLVAIVWISLGWFFAALPIITIGPATVGAYRAVLSLHEGESGDGIALKAVLSTVRQQFIHAMLIGLVPLMLLAIAATYAVAYLTGGSIVSGLLALVGVYAGLYAWLVSIPTLLGLAEGLSAIDALTNGCHWTAYYGVEAVALGVVTAALFVITSLLTVAVVLLFAGVTCTLHVEFVGSSTETEQHSIPILNQRET